MKDSQLLVMNCDVWKKFTQLLWTSRKGAGHLGQNIWEFSVMLWIPLVEDVDTRHVGGVLHPVFTLSMEAFEYYYCLKRHLLIFPCGPCNTFQDDHKAYYQSHINILPLFCDFVPAIATFNLKSVSVWEILKVWLFALRFRSVPSCPPFALREHLPGKKMFSFGHCPNEGGEGLARIKKYTLYIPFWRPKKLYKLPELGGGGGRGNLGNARKKSNFFLGGVT